MTHGSLFSGIGGFDLAARRCGWTNVFQCEIDPFCQKVLKYHFPETELYEDIKTADFRKYRGTIDVVSGGFPCQPFSVAGKRKGSDDNRFLWPEMLRVIRDVQPSWVVAENVYGIVSQERGMVFERVCSDLENSGYEVQPINIPACSVDAPHRRERIWIVSYRIEPRIKDLQKRKVVSFESETSSDSLRFGRKTRRTDSGVKEKKTAERKCVFCESARFGKEQFASDPTNKRLQRNIDSGEQEKKRINDKFRENLTGHTFLNRSIGWENFPTQSPVCGGNDGIPERLDGITVSKWRIESIKAYGNAIVPQVAYAIFRTINEFILF